MKMMTMKVSRTVVVPFSSGYGAELIIPGGEWGCVVLVSWGECGPFVQVQAIGCDGGPVETVFTGWLENLREAVAMVKDPELLKLVMSEIVPVVEKKFEHYY